LSRLLSFAEYVSTIYLTHEFKARFHNLIGFLGGVSSSMNVGLWASLCLGVVRALTRFCVMCAGRLFVESQLQAFGLRTLMLVHFSNSLVFVCILLRHNRQRNRLTS